MSRPPPGFVVGGILVVSCIGSCGSWTNHLGQRDARSPTVASDIPKLSVQTPSSWSGDENLQSTSMQNADGSVQVQVRVPLRYLHGSTQQERGGDAGREDPTAMPMSLEPAWTEGEESVVVVTIGVKGAEPAQGRSAANPANRWPAGVETRM